MKITIDKFSGVFPRIAKDKLPNGAAANAVNCRFLADSVGPWNNTSLVATLPKEGEINTVYGMAIDTDIKWLHWTEDELGTGQVSVDVARGTVQGDASERTYYTGTDVPRVTNLTYATTGDTSEEYPYISYKLGVPAPVDVPILEVVAGTEEEEIVLTNGDAEEGDTTGWVIDSGQLDVLETAGALLPFEGSYFFSGGTTALTSVAIQSVTLLLNGITEGQPLTVTWRQASGANLSKAGMSLVFKDVDDMEIGRVDGEVIAAAVVGTWEERSISILVPQESVSVDVEMHFEKVGAGDVDAYIDAIVLTTDNTSYTLDGKSIDDWVKSVQYPPTITEDHGDPAPSVLFSSLKNRQTYMYKDFSIDKRSSITLDFIAENITEQGINLSVIFADSFGSGSRVEFTGSKVFLGETTAWSSATRGEMIFSGVSILGDYSGSRINISLQNEGAGIATATISAYTLDDNTLIFSVERSIEVGGGFLGLHAVSDAANSSDRLYVDNLTLTMTSVSDNQDEDINAISYVYTYVNLFDEEGPPSDPSSTILKDVNNDTNVTTSTTAPSGYGIDRKRIYRLATGTAGTDYFFVEELPLATATYLDSIPDDELEEVLSTVDYDLPPEDGANIIALPNGITAMSSGNDIAISVQFRPHAYPIQYYLTTDYPIVAMKAIDTTLIVATQSYTYAVLGSSPETLSMSKFEQIQGCVSKRSMVNMRGKGVVYASADGLVGTSGAGNLHLLTENFFTRKEWQLINPEEIIAFVHDDKYFGFTSTTGFLFDVANGTFTWLDFVATAGFVNPITDTLYLFVDGELVSWDTAETKLPYTWQSGVIKLPRPVTFECAEVDSEYAFTSTTLTFAADGVDVYTKSLTDDMEFILPAVDFSKLQLTLEGVTEVSAISIAESMEELAT